MPHSPGRIGIYPSTPLQLMLQRHRLWVTDPLSQVLLGLSNWRSPLCQVLFGCSSGKWEFLGLKRKNPGQLAGIYQAIITTL
ncbi:TPA: hypothetical protein PXN54_004431 [Yersinia enterocolitica]|nr:hypothetical protein [Yersinia enterocolitica]